MKNNCCKKSSETKSFLKIALVLGELLNIATFAYLILLGVKTRDEFQGKINPFSMFGAIVFTLWHLCAPLAAYKFGLFGCHIPCKKNRVGQDPAKHSAPYEKNNTPKV